MAKMRQFRSAIVDGALNQCLARMSLADLMSFTSALTDYRYYWMGTPTVQTFLDFRRIFPQLDRCLNYAELTERLHSIDGMERTTIGIGIDAFFPELKQIVTLATERIGGFPQGIEKAECWLRPLATSAGADASVEAAVYFASRGKLDLINVSDMRTTWHDAVCRDIEFGIPGVRVPVEVVKRARARVLSLSEISEILSRSGSIPRFFSFRDEEEDFIDATMFRAVQWFEIGGFEPWLRSFANDFSDSAHFQYEKIPAAWNMFFWCRSDLALRMSSRQGLEAALHALTYGSHDREKPWRVVSYNGTKPRLTDYTPIASILLFAGHRNRNAQVPPELQERAIELLTQTASKGGGWPAFADDGHADIMATCAAIHGLSRFKIPSIVKLVREARDWLASVQEKTGEWRISGGPTVMITVLVLDSIHIADGGQTPTFRMSGRSATVSRGAVAEEALQIEEPKYDYVGQAWFEPSPPMTASKTVADVKSATAPKVVIVVATDVELRQVLRVMKPLPRKRQVWKVIEGAEVYYAGVFGRFPAVVVLSGMGSEGPVASALTTEAALRRWKPKLTLLVGIAFGADRKKHPPADVLVSEFLCPYELKAERRKPEYRSATPASSAALIQRFRTAIDWKFLRPDKSACKVHFGPLLSGQKLVDDPKFKARLLEQWPNAIGGEMEGAGFWSAAERLRRHWIVVKAVCDWGDGNKHKEYQPMAAAAAVSLCQHVFSDKNALRGL